MLIILKIILAVLLAILLLGFLRTWQMGHDERQQLFLKGVVPNPPVEGFYQGVVGFSTSWDGKKFDAKNSTGINVIKSKAGSQTEKYPFKAYAGGGLFDKDLQVLKIDYNIPGNPFWLRHILDEIVETSPGHYLGKMHVRIFPGLSFSFLYFELKK